MSEVIKKQIFAMGGGGFSMEPDNPMLDRYVLSLVEEKKNPKVCFVPTASGDADGYIKRFYQYFEKEDCQPFHLSLFKPPIKDIESYVLGMDIIYVGGGNTNNLLILWKEWGLDRIFRKAYEAGIVLVGVSAGAICWFEGGVTDSIPGELTGLTCLGFLKGSNSPHYDGEKERRPAFHKLILEGVLQNGIGTDDGVGLHYIDGKLTRIVSSRPYSKAYCVKKIGTCIEEKMLEVNFLGK